MYDNATDQGWQQLEDRIENLVGYLLKMDKQRIEYKPQFTAPLLEMPSACHDGDQQPIVE